MPDYAQGTPKTNCNILVEYHSLRNVVSSAAKAETGGSFHNAQKAIPIHHLLKTMFKYRQPSKGTPITTNNLTSQGILTNFVKPKRLITWDMRYHYFGNQGFQTLLIILQNIILHLIIAKSVCFIYINNIFVSKLY